jgi:hypothetical protein
MEFEKNYHAYNGTKLEYSTTEDGAKTRIYGLRTIPDVGGEPNRIDTTDLDNEIYETNMYGLKPAQAYNFDFNMQDPSAEANIKLASDLEDSGLSYYWTLTYSNGVIVKFQSKVKTTILGGQSNDLVGFQIHLAPKNEPERIIPTSVSL